MSTQIVEAGGDYLWLVNDNQPALRQDIEDLFVPELNELGTGALPTDCTRARTVRKGMGALKNVPAAQRSFSYHLERALARLPTS